MATDGTTPITFVVPGAPAEAAARGGPAMATPSMSPLGRGTLKQSVVVGAARGAGGEVRVQAVPGEDVVLLHLGGGPTLVLHPETARDLMQAQAENVRSRSADDAADGAEVLVPVELRWRGLEEAVTSRGPTRGLLGSVLLRAVEVVKDFVVGKAADWTVDEIVARVDGQVDPGVYELGSEVLPKLKGRGALDAMPVAPEGRPLLVLVHGTFVDTASTFGKLWSDHPSLVRSLFDFYANRVFALDHPTLGQSPIENALTLAKACPKGARLHLVTHSRGGLVAEVLARACGSAGLTPSDRALFAGKGFAPQLAALETLVDLVRRNDIRVDRIVRVACPARGTLLASKRLDAYVSVFKWTLELAGMTIAAEIADFLGAVAQRRTDPAAVPGLEAQMPDSSLVRWLHAGADAVPGELRVVAGDIEGDSVTSWVKTLLADAFYWTDNDLVVQTRSMYGGAPRRAGATFLLDRGGAVSHFTYFTNPTTAEAVVNALTKDSPQGYRVIGPLSWAGESASGVRAALRAPTDGKPLSEKPAVVMLPGILGSNLKVDGERVWLGWRLVNGLERLAYKSGDGVEPDGPIDMVYDDLVAFLSKTHEVIEFAYDWRRPMEEEARRLAGVVDAALTARERSGTPVRFIAHSMGGLVARTMQLERPDVWNRMMANPRARMLMLGTPNGGSWAPMQVLSCDDTFGNALVMFGAPFQDREARALMASFPGFIQLQAALLDSGNGRPLANESTWAKLAADDLETVRKNSVWHRLKIQLNVYSWGVPSQAVLDSAVALRKRLDAQREHDVPAFADKLLLVTGKAAFTPAGYELGPKGVEYLDAPDTGDGRVTLENARLPGVRTWTVDCEHGKLPEKEDAFDAYLELLENGATAKLSPLASGTQRGAEAAEPAPVRSRPSRSRPVANPPERPGEILWPETREIAGPRPVDVAALAVTIVNGDLRFVRQPLMLGHYESRRLTGTEGVMDALIGGTMSASLAMRQYSDEPGTHQVFINGHIDPENPVQPPRPEAVIVVGLGPEGKLRASDLANTVRLGAIAWAQRLIERPAGSPGSFDLAATLIGSGGSGISAGQAAQLIAQGVWEANQRLIEAKWPSVGRLILIERYLDRASEAWRALQLQATATPGRLAVDDAVQQGTGGLRRPLDAGYRGADYDYISAASGDGGSGNAVISYTLDTKRARSEVRALSTQGTLVRELVRRASNGGNADAQIGSALFRLLVPVEMEPFLGGTTELVMELDAGTAAIPWELLDTDSRDGGDARPWAIRAKLLRKLRTAEFRANASDSSKDDDVLIIGEPECDPKYYPRLRGARAEALAVKARLEAPDGVGADRVQALISPDDPARFGPNALEVIGAVLGAGRDWRIIHIAGHGEPPERIGPAPVNADDPPQRDGDPRGVVLSAGTFLGPREIEGMRKVPELVFVNCCHLAARNVDQVLREGDPATARKLGLPYDRARFAATVAEELIRIGIRCVIAAGWAVGDEPAKAFATRFYDALLRGRRFIDAVAEAREAARELGGDTWGAYQCYGDPDWVFTREGADPQRPPRPLADEFAGVASADGLRLALETLTAEITKKNVESQRAKLRYLQTRYAPKWGNVGVVAETFARAWDAARDRPAAVAWYERAVASNDGSASMKAPEQLGNLRARMGFEQAKARFDAAPGDETARAKNAAVAKALNEARESITSAIAALEQHADAYPTIERSSLCGSAYKRLALVEAMAGRPAQEREAIVKMREHYARAETRAHATNDPDLFYPALNRMAAEVVVDAASATWKGFDTAETEAVRQSLARKVRDTPDFWSVVGVTELRLYVALGAKRLVDEIDDIVAGYAHLHARDDRSPVWESVLDQLDFVLPKYAKRSSAAEATAAGELRTRVEAMVRGAGAATRGASRPKKAGEKKRRRR